MSNKIKPNKLRAKNVNTNPFKKKRTIKIQQDEIK